MAKVNIENTEFDSPDIAPPENQAIIEVAETFSQDDDDWKFDPGLEVIEMTRNTASVGRDALVFQAIYGPRILEQVDSEKVDVAKFSLAGGWVRVQVPVDPAQVDQDDPDAPKRRTVFLGRIEDPRDVLHGDQLLNADNEKAAKGEQRWASGGGRRFLEKLAINDSSWLREIPGSTLPDVFRLDRKPGFNVRDGDDQLVGNRSAVKSEDPNVPDPLVGGREPEKVYHFGGTDVWSAVEIANHAFEVYVHAQLPEAGPWFNGIVLSQPLFNQLKQWKPKIELASVRNVAELFDQLFSVERGMDWYPMPTETGYQINVFPLLPETPEFIDLGYPVNTNLIRFDASAERETRVDVNVSQVSRHEKVRIRGNFCTVTGTVAAGSAVGITTPDELVAGWSSDAEQLYRDGDPTGNTVQEHDSYRARDQFRDVFQKFIVEGFTVFDGENPVFEEVTDPAAAIEVDADRYQTTELGTLSTTPLQVGGDYTVNPPVVTLPAGTNPEFLPLFALVYVETVGGTDYDRYVPVEQLADATGGETRSGHVYALQHEIGLRIECAPNHVLARNDWQNASDSNFDPEANGCDWATLVATFTVETDHRVAIDVQLPDDARTDDGSVYVVDVPNVRFDMLAPETVVGVTDAGALLKSPNERIAINDDRPLLRDLAAGVVARYLYERARAQIQIGGRIGNYDSWLGAVLEIRADRKQTRVLTPVTSVRINWRDKRATVFCGQAGR